MKRNNNHHFVVLVCCVVILFTSCRWQCDDCEGGFRDESIYINESSHRIQIEKYGTYDNPDILLGTQEIPVADSIVFIFSSGGGGEELTQYLSVRVIFDGERELWFKKQEGAGIYDMENYESEKSYTYERIHGHTYQSTHYKHTFRFSDQHYELAGEIP